MPCPFLIISNTRGEVYVEGSSPWGKAIGGVGRGLGEPYEAGGVGLLRSKMLGFFDGNQHLSRGLLGSGYLDALLRINQAQFASHKVEVKFPFLHRS